jgi:hypothetical protein
MRDDNALQAIASTFDDREDQCSRTLTDRNLPGRLHPVNLEFFLEESPALLPKTRIDVLSASLPRKTSRTP